MPSMMGLIIEKDGGIMGEKEKDRNAVYDGISVERKIRWNNCREREREEGEIEGKVKQIKGKKGRMRIASQKRNRV